MASQEATIRTKGTNNETEKLPYCVRFSYGVGHVLNDLCASMWFTYLLVYFHMVVKFSNDMAGYLMLIGQVADAFSTPFVGFEVDRWQNGILSYGKRKSWHLIGTFCVVFSFPFIFNKCIGCIQICDAEVASGAANCWAQFIYYVPFIVIFQFGWASVQISHLSLIPKLTSHDGERVELTSIRNAFTVMAGIVVYATAWGLLSTNPTSTSAACTTCPNNSTIAQITPDDAPVFRTLVLTIVGIGVVFMVMFHCGTPENTKCGKTNYRNSTETGDHELSINNSTQVMIWRDWLKEIQFYQIALLYMCTRLVVNLSQVYMAMYVTVALHLPKHYIAIIPLLVFLSGFVISVFMRPINAFLGRKMTYAFGALLIIGACVWMWFMSANDKPMQIFGSAILLGFGTSIILVNSLSLTADLIGKQTNSGAFVYGAMSFTDKISNGIAIVSIQYFHPCQSASACPLISEVFYRKTMVFVPGSITLVALLVLLTLCKSTIGKLRKFKQFPGYFESEYQPLLSQQRQENSNCVSMVIGCCCCSGPESTPLLSRTNTDVGSNADTASVNNSHSQPPSETGSLNSESSRSNTYGSINS